MVGFKTQELVVPSGGSNSENGRGSAAIMSPRGGANTISALKASIRKRATTVGPYGAPYDFYTYLPSNESPYGTWFGCMTSTAALVLTLAFCGYIMYQFVETPYDVSTGQEFLDPTLVYSPATGVPLPRMGLLFRNGDRAYANYDERYMRIRFQQRIIYQSGESQEVFDIAAVPCEFRRTQDNKVVFEDSRCPATGYIDASGVFVAHDFTVRGAKAAVPADAKIPAVPVIQGVFTDPVYAFLQASINFDLVALENEPDRLAAMYDGEFVPITEPLIYHLSNVKAFREIPKEPELQSFRFEVLKSQVTKVEVMLEPRELERESAVFDVSNFEDYYSDIVLHEFIPVLDDVPEKVANETQAQGLKRGMIGRIYYRLTIKMTHIRVSPSMSLFDFLGVLGGVLALIQYSIGIPTRYANMLAFRRHANAVMQKGLLESVDLSRHKSAKTFSKIVDQLREDNKNKDNSVSRVIKGVRGGMGLILRNSVGSITRRTSSKPRPGRADGPGEGSEDGAPPRGREGRGTADMYPSTDTLEPQSSVEANGTVPCSSGSSNMQSKASNASGKEARRRHATEDVLDQQSTEEALQQELEAQLGFMPDQTFPSPLREKYQRSSKDRKRTGSPNGEIRLNLDDWTTAHSPGSRSSPEPTQPPWGDRTPNHLRVEIKSDPTRLSQESDRQAGNAHDEGP